MVMKPTIPLDMLAIDAAVAVMRTLTAHGFPVAQGFHLQEATSAHPDSVCPHRDRAEQPVGRLQGSALLMFHTDG